MLITLALPQDAPMIERNAPPCKKPAHHRRQQRQPAARCAHQIRAQLDSDRRCALADALAGLTGEGPKEEEPDASLISHPSSAYLGLTDMKLAILRVDLEEKLEGILPIMIPDKAE
jgi:hypothetical protein